MSLLDYKLRAKSLRRTLYQDNNQAMLKSFFSGASFVVDLRFRPENYKRQ